MSKWLKQGGSGRTSPDAANAERARLPAVRVRVRLVGEVVDLFPVVVLVNLVGPFLSQLRERSNVVGVPRFYRFADLRIRLPWKS